MVKDWYPEQKVTELSNNCSMKPKLNGLNKHFLNEEIKMVNKFMKKKCSTSLAVRKIQMKNWNERLSFQVVMDIIKKEKQTNKQL